MMSNCYEVIIRTEKETFIEHDAGDLYGVTKRYKRRLDDGGVIEIVRPDLGEATLIPTDKIMSVRVIERDCFCEGDVYND